MGSGLRSNIPTKSEEEKNKGERRKSFWYIPPFRHNARILSVWLPQTLVSISMHFNCQTWKLTVDSFTAKCVLAGIKNPCLEGFLLAKHTAHHIHSHHDELFRPQASWFWWMNMLHPGSLCRRGWTRPPPKGFSRIINKLKEKINYFSCLSVNDNNCSPVVGCDSQNGMHCCRWAAMIYELN